MDRSDSNADALPAGRRLGEIMREGSAAGRVCFIGGDAVPPIYARTNDSILEGYLSAMCVAFASLERRLLRKQARSPVRAQQMIERVELDWHGRIAVTTGALLTLEQVPIEVAVQVQRIAVEHGAEPLRLRSKSLEPITELQAAEDGILDYLLVIPDRMEPRFGRIAKRLLSRTEWSYDDSGRVIDRRTIPLGQLEPVEVGAGYAQSMQRG